MAEKKQCVHCRRSIDAAARICPYCNRDQDVRQQAPVVAAPLPPIEAAAPPKPPRRFSRDQWSTRALLIAAVIAVLMATFAVGGLVYGLGKRGDTTIGQQRRDAEAVAALDRSGRDLPGMELVADSSSTIGRPITTAPIPNSDQKVPAEFQRSDATALPSSEYARLLEESRRQQQQPPQQPVLVDPRNVKTELPGVDARPPARPVREVEPRKTEDDSTPPPPRQSEPERAPRRERAQRTEPVPIYQPLPRIKDREEEIEESGTMRFRLTIDRDGAVQEIRVIETMPGMTGKMIAAMQRWKFKPATENGVPVEGTFMVDISFNAPQ